MKYMLAVALRCIVATAATILAGCAANPPQAAQSNPSGAGADACRPQVVQLQGQLAAEQAERQRLLRAAARREEALRKQLDAMKSIERGILEREDRMRTETR